MSQRRKITNNFPDICVICHKTINPTDKYHAIKRSGKNRGYVHCHVKCYNTEMQRSKS